MIPDAATVARRRHVCTMVVRAGAAVFAVWVAIRAVPDFAFAGYEATFGGGGAGAMFMSVMQHFPVVVLVVGLALCSRKIAEWIVPYPARETGCPRCGYSLKNLKSPICPECGADVK